MTTTLSYYGSLGATGVIALIIFIGFAVAWTWVWALIIRASIRHSRWLQKQRPQRFL